MFNEIDADFHPEHTMNLAFSNDTIYVLELLCLFKINILLLYCTLANA